MENYKLLGRIGKGAHGLVFKALDIQNNRTVALKQIAVVNINNGIPKNTMREICVLRALQSKNIVKLIDIFNVESAVLIVMEHLQRSLAEVLKDIEKPLSIPQIKTYTKMILMGVDAMHSNHIMHRDLKPANLLIDDDGVLKIADFGLSRIYNKNKDRQYTHQVGTRWYRAPELLYGSQKYTPAVDMWAVGCILAEMIDKQPLFPGETDIAQLAIVLATLGTPNEEVWPGLTTLPDYNKIAFTYSEGQTWEAKFPDCDPCTVDL
ncbi:cyclin-dependent kinase 20, partial [Asbolus verrucosus]